MQRQSIKKTSYKRKQPQPSLARSRSIGFVRQANAVGGFAGRASKSELKFIDVTANNDPPIGATTFSAGTLLNGCIPGSNATNRIGRKIHMKSLVLRWGVNLRSTSVAGGNVRVLVVYDKQSNAAAPAITDILLTDDFYANNNLSNRDRFLTLIDIISPCVSTGGDVTCSGVEYRKLNLESMFNTGTAGTVADITTGSVYIFVAQTGTITTTAPDFFASARIKFLDN